MTVRVIKALMWIYLSLGVLIILAIAFALFVLPLISPDGISAEALDLMGEILLWWGIILLPFLKIGQGFVQKNRS